MVTEPAGACPARGAMEETVETVREKRERPQTADALFAGSVWLESVGKGTEQGEQKTRKQSRGG
jgi:hypothetical protein